MKNDVVSIKSDKGFSPVRLQAITLIHTGSLSIGPLGTNLKFGKKNEKTQIPFSKRVIVIGWRQSVQLRFRKAILLKIY